MSGKRAERLQVMLTIDEVRMVEEWRFENRMPSRSAAVRALMNLGLRADTPFVDKSAMLEGGVASRDVGVEDNALVSPGDEAVADRPGVLVVAADFLAGQGIRTVLLEQGLRVVGPAGGPGEAHELAETGDLAAAVIDTAGDASVVAEVADRLAERQVPFLFLAADDPEQVVPDRHRSAPVISRAGADSNLGRLVAGLVA